MALRCEMERKHGILCGELIGFVRKGREDRFVSVEGNEWESEQEVCVVSINLRPVFAIHEVLNHQGVETVAYAEALDGERLCSREMGPVHRRPDGVRVHEEGFDSLSGRRGGGIR